MTAPAPVRFTVDPWDPGYGVAFGEELDGGALEESSAELNLDLELPAASWRPVAPDPALTLPGTVLFLDGVRRIDARVWVHGTRPQPSPGSPHRSPPASCPATVRPASRMSSSTAACSPPPPRQPASPPAG